MKNRVALSVLMILCITLSGCHSGNGDAGFSASSESSEISGSDLSSTTFMTTADTSIQADSSVPLYPQVEEASPPIADASPLEVLEIGEKMFWAQIDDIYFNFDDYKDVEIIVEGMYIELSVSNDDYMTPSIYRRGPGCCGNDGQGGFLLHYDGERPAENEWIKVTGTPELVPSEYGFDILYLNVISFEIKEERGAEFVAQ